MEKTRANWVPAPHYFNLNQACVTINRAFEAFGDCLGCHLVGSSLERRDWRDIDVRYIMLDEAFDRLFGGGPGEWTNPLWSLLCVTFSAWLSEQSNLPVDFQIQRMTQANAEHHGKRSALGIFVDYPGELPSRLKPPTDGSSKT